jgi:DNA-binding NarL/FixJ family response regulator
LAVIKGTPSRFYASLAYIFVFCFATPIKYQKKEGVKFGLTEREMEVLQYLADGLDNREIADKLYLQKEP